MSRELEKEDGGHGDLERLDSGGQSAISDCSAIEEEEEEEEELFNLSTRDYLTM